MRELGGRQLLLAVCVHGHVGTGESCHPLHRDAVVLVSHILLQQREGDQLFDLVLLYKVFLLLLLLLSCRWLLHHAGCFGAGRGALGRSSRNIFGVRPLVGLSLATLPTTPSALLLHPGRSRRRQHRQRRIV